MCALHHCHSTNSIRAIVFPVRPHTRRVRRRYLLSPRDAHRRVLRTYLLLALGGAISDRRSPVAPRRPWPRTWRHTTSMGHLRRSLRGGAHRGWSRIRHREEWVLCSRVGG